jgi:hypothetical protein
MKQLFKIFIRVVAIIQELSRKIAKKGIPGYGYFTGHNPYNSVKVFLKI